MTVARDIERARAARARNLENAGRAAGSYAKFHTTGQGSYEFNKQVTFELAFVQEPWITYGSYLDSEALADALDLDDGTAVPLPVTAGFVTDWVIDHRGFYMGCYVGVRVYFPPAYVDEPFVPSELAVDIDHYFSFTAVAMKDVPMNSDSA